MVSKFMSAWCKLEHSPVAAKSLRFRMQGPIVQNRGIKIGTIRPDHRLNFWIDHDFGKNSRVPERTVYFSFKNTLQIDDTCQPITKLQLQTVWRQNLTIDDSVNLVSHNSSGLMIVNPNGANYLMRLIICPTLARNSSKSIDCSSNSPPG